MGAQLKITQNNSTLSEFQLNEEKEYILGRDQDCDLVLPAEKGISRKHLVIKFKDNEWVVESISRFGELYSKGQKVNHLTLVDGEHFSTPPFDFVLNFSKPQDVDIQPGSKEENQIPPEVPSSNPQDENLNQGGFIDADERTIILPLGLSAYIRLLGSAGETKKMFRLEGESWIAGRDSTNSIHIDDNRVSRRHFELNRKDQTYFIKDLGSVNGSLINGKLIEPGLLVPLKSGDELQIVDLKLKFELHDNEFQQKVDSAAEVSAEPIIMNDFPDVQDSYSPVAPLVYQQPFSEAQDNQAPPFVTPISQSVFSQSPPPPFDPNLGETTPEPKNRRLIIYTVFGFIVLGAIYISGILDPAPTQKTAQVLSPYEQLTPDQQGLISQSLSIARTLREQQSFELCLAKLATVHKILPRGHDGSLLLQSDCQAGQLAELERQRQTQETEQAQALEARINNIIIGCEKLLKPGLRQSDMDQCLFEALRDHPEHPGIRNLQERTLKIVLEAEEREKNQIAAASIYRKLLKLEKEASVLESAGLWKDALKVYTEITNFKGGSEKIKKSAKLKVLEIGKIIETERAELLKALNEFASTYKFKDGAILVERYLKQDPKDAELQERYQYFMNELERQMQPFYQDSIIYESVGKVEEATKFWRTILSQSLPGETYYQKSVIRLKRYGPL
jgi:pSer/pThr/pTyr-binding forkhead associated (FHA) protein/Fe2+ or Zn2+ uptake regulation protein